MEPSNTCECPVCQEAYAFKHFIERTHKGIEDQVKAMSSRIGLDNARHAAYWAFSQCPITLVFGEQEQEFESVNAQPL